MAQTGSSILKGILISVLFVIGGLGAASYGFIGLTDDRVWCDEDLMEPGDTCIVLNDGDSTSNSYSGQAAANDRQDYIFVGGGMLFVALGVASAVRPIRESRRSTSR